MYLKRIELSGFKSFARATSLEFKTPITAIVGPNGSGKSNIAEAVRFVLGEQSMKSLRGKRGEDLIWNGSKTIPRQNRASVAITFDNSKKIFDIDYDEVELKRVVFRDGVNQYLINGSQTRLKDIIELLASVHIGASSHHIISQGEADRILSASIKERRTMIEDALGLKIYQYKRAESERKLQKTRENINQVEALRREIAPHLKFLENQMEKIRKADELRDDLRALYEAYVMRERLHLEAGRKKLDEEEELTQKELNDVLRNVKEQENALQKTTAGEVKSGEIASLEQRLRDVREKKDTLSRTLGRLEGIRDYQFRDPGRNAPRADLRTLSIPEEALQKLHDEVLAAVGEANKAEDIARVKEIIASVRSLIKDFLETHAAPQEGGNAGNEAREELEKTEQETEKTTQELEEAFVKEKQLYSAYRSKREEIEKERGTERALERTLFILRGRKTELVSRLELLKVKDERLREEEKQFETECNEAKHFIGEAVFNGLGRESGEKGDTESAGEEETRSEQEARKRKIERIKIKIEDIGTGGSEIMKEYEEVSERDAYLSREIEDLEKSAEALSGLIGELGEKIDTEFKSGIKKINTQFQELFSLMFGGGSASLKTVSPPPRRKRGSELEEMLDEAATSEEDGIAEAEEGIDIAINLPHKRLKSLAMLSGGERALTSIALIFAITQVNPPPFLILDETDAALDESNSRKYGDLLESLSKKTELVIITHNRETMSRAGVLYGVTSASDGISRLLSIQIDEAVELAE